MTKFGDTPFDPSENAFTVAEAALVSGVSEFDIRNWKRREVVPVGKKNRLGRIMFSALDIVMLRVIGDLNCLMGVDPSNSAAVALQITTHCRDWMQKENHHLHATDDGGRRETRIIISLGDDCKTPSISSYEWGDTVFGFKIAERGRDNQWTRRPFIIFPVEQIFGDVLDALFKLLENEEG